jgi:hypothetical protein
VPVEGGDEAGLGRRQQFGEGVKVAAERGADRERGSNIDADDDRGVRRETKLAGAAEQNVPGLPAGVGQRLVIEVGTAMAIGAGLTVGARTVQRYAAGAISWPAAEVPFGAGADAFFSSSSSNAGPR